MPDSTRGRPAPARPPATWVSGAVSIPAICADMRRIVSKRVGITCNRPPRPGVVTLEADDDGRDGRTGVDTTGRVREVYATSYRRLVGQLTGVTGDPVEAEDVVMEAFARAVTKSRAFATSTTPRPGCARWRSTSPAAGGVG